MTPTALSVLACPSCRRGYQAEGQVSDNGALVLGRLTCQACGLQIPVLDGFALFTEPRMTADQVAPTALREMTERLFGAPGDYDDYRVAKFDRGLQESYAAFQPFNESTRAAEPLLATLAAHLRPGDVILDMWGRTGWSGEWLAGLFPDHHVISLWEGDASVLGYRGFRHWLGQGRRARNLDILFVPPNRPLPFADHSVGVVYGLDCLHRYDLYPFAGECLRVARPDGALLFAHLHLTNAEPDPFFERGCRQIHGRDYRAWLDQALLADQRRGWVLSEATLFEAAPGEALQDDPGMDHYNGAVLIADPARSRLSVPTPADPGPRGRFLLNPLFRLRPSRGDALVDDGHNGGEVGRLLDRHPIYRARLPSAPVPLADLEWLTLALALTGSTRAQIDTLTGGGALGALIAAELLLPVSVSRAAVDLQRFHANQLPPGDRERGLERLLRQLQDQPSAAIDLPDGSSLSGADLSLAVRAAMILLERAGLAPGAALALAAPAGPVDFILLLAGLSAGLEVVLNGAGDAGPERTFADAETFAEDLGALIDQGPTPMPTQPGGAVSLVTGGQTIRLDAVWLLEAAGSLRHAVGTERPTIYRFGAANTLLFCLMRLLKGEAIVFATEPGIGTP